MRRLKISYFQDKSREISAGIAEQSHKLVKRVFAKKTLLIKAS